jgi:hypothetical protein
VSKTGKLSNSAHRNRLQLFAHKCPHQLCLTHTHNLLQNKAKTLSLTKTIDCKAKQKPACLLPMAPDQINPLVQVRADVIALERAPLLPHEFRGAALRPRRQLDVVHSGAGLRKEKIFVGTDGRYLLLTCVKKTRMGQKL